MQQDVVMPSLGEDAGDECTVSFWHAEPGEQVEKDGPLVEMTTDKAVFDVPSPVAGKIIEAFAHENDVVKVGERIAVIEVTE